MVHTLLPLVVLLGVPALASPLALISKGRKAPFVIVLASIVAALCVYIVCVATGCLYIHTSYFIFDSFSSVLTCLTLVVGLLIVLYSYDYMSPRNREHPVTDGWSRYYSLLALFVSAIIGVAAAGNLVLLAAFYELTTLCSAALIAFYGNARSSRSALEAFAITTIGGLALICAAAVVYTATNSVSFNSISLLHGNTLMLVALLFLIAAWAKSAQLPFHIWLPDAMVAPTTVSAYLHSASMVNVGVFVLARFLQYSFKAFSINESRLLGIIILADSIITMFYAAFSYFRAIDLKRILAYSTILQLSIMFCAESITLFQQSLDGVYAAIYHMWNHAYTKALLFLSVGALSYTIGRRDISAISGIASKKELRIIAFGWLFGALSVSAIPPFSCFFSKLAILLAGFKGPLLALVGPLLAFLESYLITLPVFLRIALAAFSKKQEASNVDAGAVPILMRIALIVLMLMTIVSALAVPMKVPGF